MKKLQVRMTQATFDAQPKGPRSPTYPIWFTVAFVEDNNADLPDVSSTYPTNQYEYRTIVDG